MGAFAPGLCQGKLFNLIMMGGNGHSRTPLEQLTIPREYRTNCNQVQTIEENGTKRKHYDVYFPPVMFPDGIIRPRL